MLPQTRLGKTDLLISRLGLGTVKFGRNSHVKYPQAFTLPSDAEARALLNLARDLGINLLDTAASYGASEERLGGLLRGERKDWVICSKAGENYDGLQSQFDFSPVALRKSLDRSLRHLRTDYLDILLIHSDGNDSDIIHRDQVFHSLAQFKKEGWIRAFGMSSKTPEGAELSSQYADLVMTTFDPAQESDQCLLDKCAANNSGVLLKKIFDSGHLLHADPTTPTRSRLTAIEQQMQLIFAHKAVNSAIIGTLNCQHLRDNAACALGALAP
ncbi:MAG TPA: aldo/keto reductase [Cellvibrio sp.]|nr:aldo/keto reductase [Cellvibrio sp.]